MSLTLAEAITALSDPQYQTLDGLRELVAQVSVRPTGASPDAQTLLYSGKIGGVDAWTLAEPIGAASGGSIITISQTDAAKFLNSREFESALKAIVGDTAF